MADDPRVVLLTGASRGIGATTVDAFLETGARVVTVSRTLAGREHERVLELAGDVADPGTATAVVGAALGEYGRLDVLVNNAALDLAKPLTETTPDEARRIFAVNALGPLWMIQAATEALGATRGAIVNVTSRLAHVGVPEMAVYGASKGAVRALTHGAAIELAPRGIRVNAVAPGMAETPLLREWLAEQDDPAAVRAKVEGRIPLGRLAAPEEIAAAIVFLAGEGAGHITGVTLPIDGGYTAA